MAKLNSLLYVDDEPDIRMLAQLALEQIGGMTVKACESGKDAFKLLETWRPQAILLDVMMPGQDGPAVLKALRDSPSFADIPVLFLTGRADRDHVEGLMNAGAIGVIAKPFDPVTLASQVQAIWEEHDV